MIYVVLPRGFLDWDDIRVFTSLETAMIALQPEFFLLAFEGGAELKPVWMAHLEGGTLRRFPLSQSP